MKYDIIVIGAGSGGLNIAGFMNKAGFKTLLIDKSDKNIGGDCLNFGCIPSKALIHISKLAYSAKEASKFGLKVTGKIDLSKVAKYVDDKREIIRVHENADYFRKQGMDVVLGLAKFVSKNSVSVNGIVYTGKKIVIATGSKPRRLNFPGSEKIKYHTNETIFELKKLPKRLLIFGGGPIGIEMAQAFNRLGSNVTLVQDRGVFLPREDSEISSVLMKQLEKEGVKFYFNLREGKCISSSKVVINDNMGKSYELNFDQALVAIGRELNFDGLDLDKAGIKVVNGKIKIDSYLRTTNKRVFLCGDIAGMHQFTHAAELHASVILHNFFSPIKKKLNTDYLSWVTFTSPELATFGLNKDEIERRNIKYERLVLDFSEDDRSIIDDSNGKLILYISKNKILGGSMIAMNAGEIFQELVLANSTGMDIKNLFNKIYAYPTASRVNKRIITNYFSKKLSPFAKRMLKILY